MITFYARVKPHLLVATILTLLLMSGSLKAQLKIGDNPATINKASILELESLRQGLLLPRIPDTLAAPLTTAPDGMLIFFVGDRSLRVRRNGVWAKLAELGVVTQNNWSTTGNTGTNPTNNYIGTTDAQGLSIRTAGTEAIRVNTDQSITLKQVPVSGTLVSVLVIDPATGNVSKRSLSTAAFDDAIRSLNGLSRRGITIRTDTANAALGVTPNDVDSTITVNIPKVNATTQRTGLLTYDDWLSFSSKQRAITIGAFGTVASPTGLVLDPTTGILTLTPADAANPGAISILPQQLKGPKTFLDSLYANAGLSATGARISGNTIIGGGLTLTTAPTDAATTENTVLIRNTTTGNIEKKALSPSAFEGAITSVNGQKGPAIHLTTGTAGNNIALDSTSVVNTITLNVPDAAVAARGVITTGAQTLAGFKTLRDTLAVGASAVIGTTGTNPNSTLQVSGSVAMNIRSLTSSGALTETDYTVLVNTSGGAVTVQLPAVSGKNGRIYNIKKIGGGIDNALTITPTSGQIEGSTSYIIYNDWTFVTLQTDGANWYVIRK